MQKAVCIVGPTAVGKTQLALALAKRCNVAIISCDSVQIYKRLDIISGKDIPYDSEFIRLPISSKKNLNVGYYVIEDVPYYMVDVVEPTEEFSISDFFNIVKICLNHILEQKKVPIFVGGSGLYINSIIHPSNTLHIAPDYVLRNELERLSLGEVQKRLKALDSNFYEQLNNSERHNKRRLIRKIEILKSRLKIKDLGLKNKADLEFLLIGLELSKERLQKKIHKRVRQRLKQGAVIEAKSLFDNYENLSPQVKNTIGYKDLFGHLKGGVSIDEAVDSWTKHEIQLVKKQKTWFKKENDIHWFEADRRDLLPAVEREIDSFLED